jgi:hypothetical protein
MYKLTKEITKVAGFAANIFKKPRKSVTFDFKKRSVADAQGAQYSAERKTGRSSTSLENCQCYPRIVILAYKNVYCRCSK